MWNKGKKNIHFPHAEPFGESLQKLYPASSYTHQHPGPSQEQRPTILIKHTRQEPPARRLAFPQTCLPYRLDTKKADFFEQLQALQDPNISCQCSFAPRGIDNCTVTHSMRQVPKTQCLDIHSVGRGPPILFQVATVHRAGAVASPCTLHERSLLNLRSLQYTSSSVRIFVDLVGRKNQWTLIALRARYAIHAYD